MNNFFLSRKNILIISPESWNHLPVSKHHYAIELGRYGNQVFFLNPPTNRYACLTTRYENVWELNYTPFVKGLRFLPGWTQRLLMNQKFQKLQRIANVEFDLVWSFDNSVFFDLSFFPKTVFTISHIVDYSQNFQFSKASGTANLCLGVSQNIVARLKQFNTNSFLIPHGLSIFSEIAEVILPGYNSVKAVYAGNLNSIYLDRITLFKLIDEFPSVDFIFAGPGGKDWPKAKNCFYIGVIERSKLMNYLKKADILLLLYDEERFCQQLTNAHKILEYLYSGKTIVSSRVSDYENRPELLQMSRKENVSVLFKKVICNLQFYNSQKNIQMRRDFAEQNTYRHRIEEVEAIIQKYLFKGVPN